MDFFFDGRGRHTPVMLDLSALRSAGDDYAARASELERLFSIWEDRHSFGLRNNRHFQEYLDLYGDLTPIVILPLPIGVPIAEFPPKLEYAQLPALIAAGRLVVANVEGRRTRHLTSSERKRRQLELGSGGEFGPVLNASPISEDRFRDLMRHVEGKLNALLSNWSRSWRAREAQRAGGIYAHEDPRRGPARAPYRFVSYSRQNATRVRAICDELSKMGVPLWFDTDSIEGGEDWVESITQGIRGCIGMLPFCSQQHSTSKWCRREVVFADRYDKPFVPVWLTDPALQGGIELILGSLQPIVVEGLTPSGAALQIRPALI